MGPLRVVCLSLALVATQVAAQVDSNLQTLLNALMQGTEVALFTPLSDGTVQVTSFRVPGQRSAADAAALIQRARLNLANLGVAAPTGEQLATALIGGPIEVPSGRTSVVGTLPAGTTGTQIRTQIVNAGGLPQAVAVSPAGVAAAGSAATGGTAPGSAAMPNGALAGLTVGQQTQAVQLAHSQLSAMGILQPTPQQVNAMLQGGILMTPSGSSVTVPGLLSGRSTQAPIVSPLPSPTAPTTTR